MAQAPAQNSQNQQPGGGNFLSNIWDQFRGTSTQVPNSQPNSNVPQAGVTSQNNPLIPPGGIGDGNSSNSQTQQQESPLAQFKDLWETPTPKVGEQLPTNWNDPLSIVPSQSMDPAKVQEAAKRIDFSRVLDQEVVKRALSGDTQAFGEVINSVAQAAFANNAMLSSRIVDSALRAMAPKLINEALPHHMKRFGVNEGLGAENPIFNNPAVAPMLETLKTQFQNKYPKSSTGEITKMAKDYIVQFASAVGGKTPGSDGLSGKPGVGTNQEIDWLTDFLEQPSPNPNQSNQNQPF